MAETVQDLMTPNPRTVAADAPIADVARVMRDADVGAVIVMERDKVSSIVTDRDITVRAVAEGKDPRSTKTGDVCTANLVTVEPSAPAEEAVRLMRDRAIRRLPVV